jgi:molybdenum cofactor cytidylyltransferase
MISAVVLAAGESTRMGRCKQLLRVGGKTMIEKVMENLQDSGVDEIVVVLGYMSEEVAEKLPKEGVKAVVNPRYREGQSTSMKAGLGAVDPNVDAVIILLSDQPFIGPNVVDELIAGYQRTRAPIVVPTYKGRRGNPTLLDKALFAEVMGISGDTGARSVVERNGEDVLKVEVDEPGILFDIDTIEDLEGIEGRLIT